MLFMQNCPQFVVAVYGILRADAVVVPVNPMNQADEFGHYITDSGARVAITTADLARHRGAGRCQRCRPRSACAQLLVTHFTDAMPEPALDPRRCADAGDAATGCSPRPSCRRAPRRGATRWPPASRRGPHERGARRHGGAALHLGHHRPAQGLHAHAPHADAQRRRRRPVGPLQAPRRSALGVVPMFHITGLHVRRARAAGLRGATVVMMPRWDRELAGAPDLAPQGDALDLHPDDDHRPVRQPQLRELRPVQPALPRAAAARRCRRRWRSGCSDEFGLTFAEGYGLTETAAPTHANPPERAKLQCLGIPIFGVDSRVVDPERCEELPIGETGEIVMPRPDGVRGLLEPPRGHRSGLHRVRRQALLPHRRPGPHGRGGLLLHHRPPEAHDQRQRLQGLAGRGRGAAVQAARVQEACIIAARTPTAARR